MSENEGAGRGGERERERERGGERERERERDFLRESKTQQVGGTLSIFVWDIEKHAFECLKFRF